MRSTTGIALICAALILTIAPKPVVAGTGNFGSASDVSASKNARSYSPDGVILNSLADLKKYKAYDGQIVTTSYRTSSGDGGGGQWEWSSTLTKTPDDALIVQSSLTSTGRWVRIVTNKTYYTTWWAIAASSSDQSLKINNMIYSLPSGVILSFPAGKIYNIASTIIVGKPVVIRGNGSLLNYAGSATTILSIRSSSVMIDGLNAKGDSKSYYVPGAIFAVEKTKPTLFFSNITIKNCKLYNYRYAGIMMRYVNNFTISNNTIYDVPYAGILMYSCSRGLVQSNTISNISGVGTPQNNAYGIEILRQVSNFTDPIPEYVAIANNKITNIPWEGIDTHGGRNLSVYDNTITNCRKGIAMVSIGNTGGESAPKNILISNNVVTQTSGYNMFVAIQFDGWSLSYLASGVIADNYCKGAGIKIQYSKGVLIHSNRVEQASDSYGINLLDNNYVTNLINNQIIDVWNVSSNNTAAIKYSTGYNDSYQDGNTLVNGSFTVPSGTKNRFGFRPNNVYSTDKARIGKNNFTAATRAQYENATYAVFNTSTSTIKFVYDANYAIASSVYHVVFAPSSITRTVTIPAASSYKGRVIFIKNTNGGSGVVKFSLPVRKTPTVNTTSLNPSDMCSIWSDGTYWWMVNQNF